MRYTTLIDISEYQALYRNHNVRLVYLHLVLKSGWHDNDRDILEISFRSLAADTGLTVSAVRHAISLLVKAELLTREGFSWRVKKFCLEQKVTSRKQANATKANEELTEQMRQVEEEKIARQRAIEEWWKKATRQELAQMLENFRNRKSYFVEGYRVYPTIENIEILENRLKRK